MTKTLKLNLAHIWESWSQSNLSSDWRRKPDHLKENLTNAAAAVHARVRENNPPPPRLYTSSRAVVYLADRSTDISTCEVEHNPLQEKRVMEHSCVEETQKIRKKKPFGRQYVICRL